jgi:UDP-N-acetylmuramate--alanine ligase
MKHIHLIGIGGSGLSGIARLLLENGYTVSGSDLHLSPLALETAAAGARVSAGHRAENVLGADVVVRSSAIPDGNREVLAAREAGIPVLKRSEFIGTLMKGKTGIAIAGTHGKTTTTAMISWMLSRLGLDPTYLIGGVALDLGSNAHAGMSDYFVVEADEYDRMFLGLQPALAVVTNIEHDHPDCFPTERDFFGAFVEFTARVLPGGKLLACTDDRGAAELLERHSGGEIHKYAYGISLEGGKQPDYLGINLEVGPNGCFQYDAVYAGEHLAQIMLAVPGEHNVRNSLAALAVVHLLDESVEQAAKALEVFTGTGRRFELRGEANGVTVVDDYAHHPSEIRATLSAARLRFANRKLWAVWQPHTYSRTRTLFHDFVRAFDDADHVIVTGVYAAREPRDENFSPVTLAQAMDHTDARFIPDHTVVSEFLLSQLRPGDVLLVLSAGDADRISGWVLSGLSRNGSSEHA